MTRRVTPQSLALGVENLSGVGLVGIDLEVVLDGGGLGITSNFAFGNWGMAQEHTFHFGPWLGPTGEYSVDDTGWIY